MLTASLLGGFRVSIDGVPVDTASRRRVRDILAYLLAHRRAPVQRDVLMDVFWPDAGRDAARNSLHVALSGVRQALREAHPVPVIERRHDAYRIAPSLTVWTDMEQFQRECADARQAERANNQHAALRHYEAASHLYEGHFLADDPYAEWAARTREALRLEAIHAQTRLVELYMARTDFAPASMLARRILGDDPCNEPVNRHLMTCYAAMSLRHLALAQYHRLASELWDTFGVPPAAETVELYERLRRPTRLAA